ncbi:MAG: hypothetical protein JSS39_00595 [Nitrospira sp.]|nr:hypothetical protein [Nitrospira sp.]
MKQLSRSVFLQVGTGVVMAWLVTGCATSGDLETMNLNLTKKLDAQTSTIRVETGGLREQVKSSKTELENLRAQIRTFQSALDQVGGFQSALESLKAQEVTNTKILREISTITTNTKQTVEGSDIRDQERFRRIEMMTGEATKQLQTAQQALSDLSGKIENVPSRVTALGTEVRSLTETLKGNYKLEEAVLKDRLRLVEEMQKQFRPLHAYEASGTSPEK